MEYDVIVVGAGFSGAVTAQQLAQAGQKVLVLEKRPQIGGNMYDSADKNGVLVHWYGPHIFHTSSQKVWEYLQQFAQWEPYQHRVLGRIDGKLVPIPFNFTSLDTLFPPSQAQKIKEKLQSLFPGQATVSVLELLDSPDQTVSAFGNFVFEKVFLHYTAKQWGTPVDQVDRSVINRVPVVLGYDDRYFQDPFQAMPAGGFTPLFKKLLSHPNIEVRLNCDALALLSLNQQTGEIRFQGQVFSGPLVFTGPVDQLFGCQFGPLPYRSLNLVFEQLEYTDFQPAAVVNYPNEEAFTRITEFKKLTGQQLPGATTILKEYPLPYCPENPQGNTPYYVISSPENLARYQEYANLAAFFPNLHLCGRLAQYKYYNMDGAILQALNLSQQLLGCKPEQDKI